MKIKNGMHVSIKGLSEADYERVYCAFKKVAAEAESRFVLSWDFMGLSDDNLMHFDNAESYSPHGQLITLEELFADDAKPSATIPDWSKAPEGATQFDTTPSTTTPWEKVEGGQIYFYHDFLKTWTPFLSVSGDDKSRVIQRPTTYDGTTLPPFGVKCEIAFFKSWVKCEIVAHVTQRKKVLAVAQMETTWLACSDLKLFRPIKTEIEKVKS